MVGTSPVTHPPGGGSQEGSLLTTKLYIPRPRPGLVPRPRLTQRLNQGVDRKLTLISAPAGFGKTTLLSEWIPTSERCVCWVSLDENDNDPIRFWTYFISSLQMLRAGLGQGALAVLNAQHPQPPPAQAVVTVLINEIAAFPDSFALVLDDYHVITTPAIHNALAFLIDHQPPNMHLMITTRADPPLPLARMRARGQLGELRSADLRLTLDETLAFLNQVMGLTLSEQEVAAVEARTEGWLAGLQLAALSMQGRADIPSYIQSFSGSHRFVIDYLAEEVLQQQPQSVQDFLLHTCILDRLNGGLCDSLADRDDGQMMLEALEAANLFIVPLDDERRWYRYHSLFSDFLRHRLSQSQSNLAPELHRRAATWFARQGHTAEAISHALHADEYDQAATWITQVGTSLVYRGEMFNLLRWIERIPEDVVRQRPPLCVIYAWVLMASGQTARAEQLIQAAEGLIPPGEPDSDLKDLMGQMAAVQATIAANQRQVERTVEYSQRALEHLHPHNQAVRAVITWNLAFAYRLMGDRTAAHQAYQEAIALSQAAGNVSITVLATIGLGNLQAAQGQTHQATAAYQRALQLATDQHGQLLPVGTEAHLGLAQLFTERNDLETAGRHLRQASHLSQRMGNLDLQVPCLVLEAKLKQIQGDVDAALTTLGEAEQLVRRHRLERRIVEVASAQIPARVAQGDLAGAAHLAQIHDLPLGQARVLLAQGRPQAALAILEPLRRQQETNGYQADLLKVLVLQALALQADHRVEEAVQVLAEALALAEPGGLMRTFLDEGQPMATLLRTVLSKRSVAPTAFVQQLLAGFQETDESPGPIAQPLIEPLSQRELEVLGLIAAGLSNQQIADQTYVAVSTVKWHIRNIYGKLGVKSRTQAIARARELDLL
jgi:LuxR family maltose regulon positive regulatory protein